VGTTVDGMTIAKADMFECVTIYLYIYIYVCLSVYMYVCMYVCMYVLGVGGHHGRWHDHRQGRYVRVRYYLSIYIYVCMSVCLITCMCVCMYVCIRRWWAPRSTA